MDNTAGVYGNDSATGPSFLLPIPKNLGFVKYNNINITIRVKDQLNATVSGASGGMPPQWSSCNSAHDAWICLSGV
jgi:hypothetical protein